MPARKAVCLEFYNPAIKCTNRVSESGRCGAHQKPAYKNNMKSERQGPEWKWLREETFRIHGSVCHECNQPGADAVDHVINNDDNSLDNLRPIHHNVAPYCNITKAAREGHEAQRGMKPASPQVVHEYVRMREPNR